MGRVTHLFASASRSGWSQGEGSSDCSALSYTGCLRADTHTRIHIFTTTGTYKRAWACVRGCAQYRSVDAVGAHGTEHTARSTRHTTRDTLIHRRMTRVAAGPSLEGRAVPQARRVGWQVRRQYGHLAGTAVHNRQPLPALGIAAQQARRQLGNRVVRAAA